MPGLRLMAELGLDGSGFARGFREAKGFAAGAAESMKRMVLEAVGIGAVEEAIRRTADTARDLVEQSERLGIGPEKLQVMREAAKLSGLEFEKLSEAIEKVGIARERALMPGREGADVRRAFGALGITGQQIQGMSGADLLLGPIRAAAQDRTADQLNMLMHELGVRGFGEVIPFLKQDLGELEKHLKDLGAIMDTETAVKLKNLSEAFSGLAGVIAATIGPALVSFAEWLMDVVTKSKVLEGLDFMIRDKVNKSKLPGRTVNGTEYSASELHSQAVEALEMMRQYELSGFSVADYLNARRADQITARTGAAGFGGRDVNTPRFPGLAGDTSQTWRQELNFLNSLIQPVADATQDAVKKSAGDFDRLRQAVQNWKDRMAALAAELNSQKKPGQSPAIATHPLRMEGDALTKIGNYFGGSPHLVGDLNLRKIALLQEISANTRRNRISGPPGFGTPGFGSEIPFGSHGTVHFPGN